MHNTFDMARNFLQTELISLRRLCELAKVNYFNIWRRQSGATKTTQIDKDDRAKLANALVKDLNGFVNDLGFEIHIRRKAD